MDNFTKYIGLLVTGLLGRDPLVIVEVAQSPETNGFFIKVRKKIPLTDRVATYNLTLPYEKIVQASPLYLDVTAKSEIDKILSKLDSVVRGQQVQ
jgi:hypothetical protein